MNDYIRDLGIIMIIMEQGQGSSILNSITSPSSLYRLAKGRSRLLEGIENEFFHQFDQTLALDFASFFIVRHNRYIKL